MLGFTTTVQPAANAASTFLRMMAIGQIPEHKGYAYADRLLVHEYASAQLCWNVDSAKDSFRFASKPPHEANGIVDVCIP